MLLNQAGSFCHDLVSSMHQMCMKWVTGGLNSKNFICQKSQMWITKDRWWFGYFKNLTIYLIRGGARNPHSLLDMWVGREKKSSLFVIIISSLKCLLGMNESLVKLKPGNTKEGSITVPLTSCLTGLESAVWQLTFFCFYLLNRLIQTSQIGGQRYSYTSPFGVPWNRMRKHSSRHRIDKYPPLFSEN